MPTQRLTATNVATLRPRPGERQTDYWDATVPRFGVRAGKRRRVFVVRYVLGGKKVRQTIGNAGSMDLADARRAADAVLEKVDDGVDPTAGAPRNLKRLTVQQLWQEYRERHRKRDGSEKRSWKSEEIRFNRDLKPALGSKLASAVTDADIETVIDAMRARGVTTGATRTFETARALFRWAVKKKLLRHAPTDGLEAPFETGKRRRYLHDDEIKRYWLALVAVQDDGKTRRIAHARVLMLMLLLGGRGGELRRAMWSDLDLERGIWRAPPERTKAERDYDLPLPPRAVALFDSQKGLSDTLVFPRLDGKPEPNATDADELNREVCKAAGVADYRPHDSRHTASTHLEAMGFDELTVSAIVGHRRQGMTGRYSHYRREKEMRVALEAWERRVLEIAGEAPPKGEARPLVAAG